MSWWFRAFAIVFLLGGCFIFSRLRWDTFDLSKWYAVLGVVLLAVFPLVGAGLSVNAFTSKIRFSETAIERETLWGRRSMQYVSIKGRREYLAGGGEDGLTRYLRLESNNGSRPLDFGKGFYKFDDAFWAWFNRLPDLDAKVKGSNFGLV
jgi:hypothetical protein